MWKKEKILQESIYIRSAADGTVFQQVAYTAPKDKFPAYYADAKTAFGSLRVADRRSR
jgi:hypothetical protein